MSGKSRYRLAIVFLSTPLLSQCGGRTELSETGSSSDGSTELAANSGTTCSMSVSDYDNSCNVDSDCRGVPDTNPCLNQCKNCPTSALNIRAASKYMADYTALSPGNNLNTNCSCPDYTNPCCRNGVCSASSVTCNGPK